VAVVEETERAVTLFTAFPGLYLTYDPSGRLIESLTKAEWERKKRTPAGIEPPKITYSGGPNVDITDEDIPF